MTKFDTICTSASTFRTPRSKTCQSRGKTHLPCPETDQTADVVYTTGPTAHRLIFRSHFRSTRGSPQPRTSGHFGDTCSRCLQAGHSSRRSTNSYQQYTIAVCNQPTRSTQPCIPPGSLNRVPASAGVKAGMSPLPGGR